jgi:ATP-dependent RNA helicase DHX36
LQGSSQRPSRRAHNASSKRQSPHPEVLPEVATRVHVAISSAFLGNTDEAFDALLATLRPPDADAEAPGPSGAAPLSTGALLNIEHPETGATPLMAAAGRGRTEVVSALLTLGASADIRTSKNGWSAEDWARELGHEETAEVLRRHAEAAAEIDRGAGEAAALQEYFADTDVDRVDLTLIEELLQYICREGQFQVRCLDHEGMQVDLI